MTQAEQVTEPVAYHAEGPVWTGALHFVDMFAGDVLVLGQDGAVRRRHVAPLVAALRPRQAGGFIYAVERGFAVDGGAGEVEPAIDDLWETPQLRMNEGACSPDGAFFAGSMARDQTSGAGALYRFDGASVTTVLSGITISNGLDWAPDGSLAYYVDTPTGQIDVFDVVTSPPWLVGRRIFARPVPEGPGQPDGLTVDAEGGVWVALYGGGAVHRYEPSGQLSEVVELPVRLVTACSFGGGELCELYITTSRENLSPGDEPEAGSIFLARPGVRGLPVRGFAA